MTEDRVKKILEVVSPAEKVELTVLYNAEITNLKKYKEDSTAANLQAWRKVKTLLGEQMAKLEEKYNLSEGRPESFATRTDVLAYLQAEGWKISQSGLYKHCTQGKLLPDKDGNYSAGHVDKYAKMYLRRLDTGRKEDDRVEALNTSKLEVEIRKMTAQAEKAEFDLAVAQGKYIPREDLELELAGRGVVLNSALRGLVQNRAAEWIELADGDRGKTADLIEAVCGEFDRLLHDVVSVDNFQVI